MPENLLAHLTLIDELDTQQNSLLDQLEALNSRIEAVLASLGGAELLSAESSSKAA